MTYELITERNLSEGLHVPFLYINDILGGLFAKVFLLMIWLIVAFGLYFAQKKSIGVGDIPASMTVASIITFVMTVLLSLIPNFIDSLTYAIVIIVALISFIFLWFSRD